MHPGAFVQGDDLDASLYSFDVVGWGGGLAIVDRDVFYEAVLSGFFPDYELDFWG